MMVYFNLYSTSCTIYLFKFINRYAFIKSITTSTNIISICYNMVKCNDIGGKKYTFVVGINYIG